MTQLGPSGERSPVPLHELGIAITRQCLRSGLDVVKIEPDEPARRATVTVRVEGAFDEQRLPALGGNLSSATGWAVTLRLESGSSHDSVTGVVVDGEVIEVVPPREEPPSPPAESGTLARRVQPGEGHDIVRFGEQIPAGFNLVRTGDSQPLAASLFDDESLLRALAGTIPFRRFGAEAEVQAGNAIVALQNVFPIDQCQAAANNLAWAVRELMDARGPKSEKSGEYVATIASMLLTAMNNVPADQRPPFQKPYLELLGSVDRVLSDSVAKLLGPNSAAQRDAFETAFTRLMGLAAEIERRMFGESEGEVPSEPPLRELLIASLLLRQFHHTFTDDSKALLRPIIVERFASQLKQEISEVGSQSHGLVLLMTGCQGVALDFVRAIFTKHIGDTEDPSAIKGGGGAFVKGPSSELRADAVECLLATGCLISKGEFYQELDERYQHAHPLVRAQLVQAMKFGIGKSEERLHTTVDRALAFLDERKPELRHLLRMQAQDILLYFPGQLAERLTADDCARYKQLSKEDRRFLLDEVLIPQISGALPPEALVPIFLHEIRSGNFSVLKLSTLKDFFSGLGLANLGDKEAGELRAALLENYAAYESEAEMAEVRRILGAAGFEAIEAAYRASRQKEALDPALSQKLLMLSAELSSTYRTEDSEERVKVEQFTLEAVVPRFAVLASEKAGAALQIQQAENLLKMRQDALATATTELRRLSPIASLIRSHPDVNQAAGDDVTRKVMGNDVTVDSELTAINKKISLAQAKNQEEKIAELEAARDELLERCFPIRADCPDWTPVLARTPLKTLIGILDAEAAKRDECAKLKREIDEIAGGRDLFEVDADGEQVWKGQSAGSIGQAQRGFVQKSGAASETGKVLRLFVSSPAIGDEAAQKIYDRLPAREAIAATARFVLSLKHPIRDTESLEEAREENDQDAFRQAILEERGFDIGPSPEVLELERKARRFDPEAEFARFLTSAISHPDFESDVREVMRTVRELAAAGLYKPVHPENHKLLGAILSRHARDREAKFGAEPSDGWSSSANMEVVRLLSLAVRMLPVERRALVDRELRASIRAWAEGWDPPRELPALHSSAITSAVTTYVTDLANEMLRRVDISIRFVKKCVDAGERIPANMRPSLLSAVQAIRDAFPPEVMGKRVQIEQVRGDPKTAYTVHPKDLFARAVQLLSPPETEERSLSRPQGAVSLRLPFGNRPGHGMGLLPRRSEGSDHPSLPG